MMKIQILPLTILLGFSTTTVFADVWPQFRGARGDGVSAESNLPVRWSNGSGIKWAVDLPGRANSCPAVNSNSVFLTTTSQSGDLVVISYDKLSGKPGLNTVVGNGKLQAKGPANLWAHRHNAATPSPIVDDKNCWAFFGTGLLVCVDAHSGEVVWQKDLQREYGAYDISFGMGSTPRLWDDLIYVSCMTKGPSYVVAFDKSTGREVWKTDRNLGTPDDHPDSYSTPCVRVHSGGGELLVSGSSHTSAYDLKTGKQNWICDGLAIDSKYGRVIASPCSADGIIVATAPNPGGGGLGSVMGIRGDGSGDISKSHKLWKHTANAPDSSTPVILDGLVYTLSDKGIATCVDLKSGQAHWRKRLGGDVYHAAVVAGDGKVYFTCIDGTVTVMEAGTGGKVLAKNRLTGTFYATPAISDGVVYLRAYEKLYAVDGK